jgi:hypothetical protein
LSEALEIIFRSFWTFVGALLLLAIPFEFAFSVWNRFMRMLNIRKQGWPPPHCDGDGDFKGKDDE